jgi:hypothetical protein
MVNDVVALLTEHGIQPSARRGRAVRPDDE